MSEDGVYTKTISNGGRAFSKAEWRKAIAANLTVFEWARL
jgi:hypothetical protein